MGDQGAAWLLFNLILGGIFFWPTVAALIWRRDRLLLIALLNMLVFWMPDADWLTALYVLLLFLVVPTRPRKYGVDRLSIFTSPRLRWLERRCDVCGAWLSRTADRCSHCSASLNAVDQACPRCGEAMEPAASLCLACGHDQLALQGAKPPAEARSPRESSA